MTIDPVAHVLEVGDTLRLTARATTSQGTPVEVAVVWSSETDTVAVVRAQGAAAVVEGRRPGTTRIRADAAGRSAESLITVVQPPETVPVAYVTVTPERRGVWELQSTQFAVRTLSLGGAELLGRDVSVWVEDPEVAEIDENGDARGLTAGLTRIVAESEGVRGYAELYVYEMASSMSFALTYDWWDGQTRPLEAIGTTTWTDDAGIERQATLYAVSGVFDVDLDAATWSRVVLAEAWAVVDGSTRTVGTAVYTGEGAISYHWTPDGRIVLDFIEAEEPSEGYRGFFKSGGELLVGLPVLGGMRDFLFRMER